MVDLTNYRLTFDDEFSGTSLDTSKWNVWTKEHSGYPQDEPRAANVTVSNGQLHLAVAKGGTDDGRPYSSAMVDTSGKVFPQFGYMEASIQVPNASGIWPAFWTFPQSGQWTSEIDINEMFLADRFTNNMSLHFPDSRGDHFVTQQYAGPDFSAGFHTFGAMWTPSSITWYVDGVQRFQTTQHIPQDPMFLILNSGVDNGSSRPWNTINSSTPFPNSVNVDWVHVYAANGGDTTSPPPPLPPPDVMPKQLALILSEDAYKGDAKFIVKVDGTAVNGATQVTALHTSGATQEFDYTWQFGSGQHDVEIDFTNDKYGGSVAKDRNLYVENVKLDSTGYMSQEHTLFNNGAFHVTVGQ